MQQFVSAILPHIEASNTPYTGEPSAEINVAGLHIFRVETGNSEVDLYSNSKNMCALQAAIQSVYRQYHYVPRSLIYIALLIGKYDGDIPSSTFPELISTLLLLMGFKINFNLNLDGQYLVEQLEIAGVGIRQLFILHKNDHYYTTAIDKDCNSDIYKDCKKIYDDMKSEVYCVKVHPEAMIWALDNPYIKPTFMKLLMGDIEMFHSMFGLKESLANAKLIVEKMLCKI